jgi:CHAT domain-containing protein
MALLGLLPAGAEAGDCFEQISPGHVLWDLQWRQRGSTVERKEITLALGAYPLLVRLAESGVDVELEILDRAGAVIARSASPVERNAVQYAYLPAGAGAVTLVATAKDPAGLEGTVRITFLTADVSAVPTEAANCAEVSRRRADADMAYARGRAVTVGLVSADAGAAREAFESAASAYKAALDALLKPGHASERGDLELSLAALTYFALKDWSSSATWAGRAAVTFAGIHEAYRRARAQGIEAAAWIELATKSAAGGRTARMPEEARSQLAAARALLIRLAEFHAARNERYDWALQINNIGLAYMYEARFESGIPYFSRAQQAFERLGDSSRAALALQNIALCDWGVGRLSAALTKFDRALELMRSMARPYLYLITLNNSGLVHYAAGHFDESLRLETEALDVATRLQSDQARARSDYGLGLTYYAMGDRELAADFLRRGLEVPGAQVDTRTRVPTLRALAQIEYETGRVAEAIRHDSEALRLASAPPARARILLRLAQDYAVQGDVPGARRILDELIAHPSYHDELVQAMARVQRGHLLRAAGSTHLAERDLAQGIQILDRLDALAERFDARVELARVYAERGQVHEALAVLRRALKYSDEIRVQTANPEYRTSIVQSLRPAISLEVDLLRAQFTALLEQGHLAAARALAKESLAAVDSDRASGFQAWRAEYLEQHSDTELAHLLSSSSTLYRDMAERRYQLADREDRAGTDDPQAKALREDIARLRARLDLTTSQIAKRSRSGDGDDAHEATVLSIERALEPGQAVVEYWLGTSRAYAWVLSGGSIDWIDLNASRDIERAARTLYEAMRSPAPAASRREAGTELYRLAFAPVSRSVGAAQELTIVPDGPLHYTPFAALYDPARGDKPYLVQTITLSVAPALRFLPHSSVKPSSPGNSAAVSRVLIVADPIYSGDDPRLGAADRAIRVTQPAANDLAILRGTGGSPSLERLESSAREASDIRALFGPEQVDLLQGADATRDAVLAKDLTRYRFIHIASHGLMDSEIPQLSALILGTHANGGPVRDPYLRAGDLLTRTFRAEAVVLSGCDTALGKQYGSDGFVGLRYAALARGAHAVVASLWPVSDGVAARLMTDMYRGVIASDKSTPRSRAGRSQVAHALAQAMREALGGVPGLDPALWAPFTVYVAGD